MAAVLLTAPAVTLKSVFSPAVVVTIAGTHSVHTQRDGQAELAWVVD